MTTANNASSAAGPSMHPTNPPGAGTRRAAAPGPELDMFNRASATVLKPQLTELSGSSAWAEHLLAARPFHTLGAALTTGDEALSRLSRSDVAMAIASHPALGSAPEQGTASEEEQATLLGTLGGDDAGARELARLSHEYESRFGHVFLLCARGRDAGEVLDALRSRIGNDVETEWAETVEQLRLINRARLADLIGDGERAAA
ncbi:2-oxo-4-hydroxy-4-carboxy-5-ureidoimidazoline decarboxylase [Corynebacterium sp. NPDC060344]|uniref:2-oxo-4-hydroxy-4-carboxy-5-ureidoimidazoline decarboxylase n=1 Tax=Corynebacterium sp. NPDC060344 TaxID=3347101 RepID=UPI00365902BD